MTTEKEIGGHFYRIGRLSARTQLHIVRRIAPVFADSAPMVIAILRQKKGDQAVSLDALVEHFGAAAKAFKAMSDEDVDYVVAAAMGVTQRQAQGGAVWGPVLASNGVSMYADIGWSEILQLTWAAVEQNVLNFLAASPSTLSAGAA